MSDSAPASQAKPHSENLRRWRQDLAGRTYFIVTCTHNREPLLARSEVANVVWDALRFAEEEGWVMVLGYVIMPDHWHVIWELGNERTLAGVMQSVKRWSARKINALLARRGPVWQDGYYEHLVRDRADLEERFTYIALNPVKAGLAERIGEYRWCSLDGLTRATA